MSQPRPTAFSIIVFCLSLCLPLLGCHRGTTEAAPALAGDDSAQQTLGHIDFPNSGAEAAQAAFRRGVLFLHNFEYEDARTAFREARDLDPDFALAYWGEAQTHNHPIWMQQDRDQARTVLDAYAPSAAQRQAKTLSDRERGYLHTVDVLYGLTPETEGLDKDTRDDLYRDEMAKLGAQFPDDDEARAFQALSILGTAHEGRDFRTYMQAAAVAGQVWAHNDQHPGAAHYLIHSFDDPIHAPLGLPMARVYAKIAPDAGHAQHMTSHIFVALGLWNDVASANEAARRVQTARQRELDQPETVCGHYPYWLQYSYLQLERFDDARAVLAACEQRMEADHKDGEAWHYALMRGRQILDSEGTEAQSAWGDLPQLADMDSVTRDQGKEHHWFVQGYTAAARKDRAALSRAHQVLDKLAAETARSERTASEPKIIEIEAAQLKGLLQLNAGQTALGLRTLADAAIAEEALPYAFGPPEVIKPTWELLGEQRLRAGQAAEAAQAFEKQLDRTPGRIQSTRGLAEAREAQKAQKPQSGT